MRRAIEPTDALRLLNGGPVALVTTRFRNETNVMPAIWTISLSRRPPLIGVAVNPSRHSHDMLRFAEEFALNFPGRDLLNHTHYFGAVSGANVGKLELAKLPTVRGHQDQRAPHRGLPRPCRVLPRRCRPAGRPYPLRRPRPCRPGRTGSVRRNMAHPGQRLPPPPLPRRRPLRRPRRPPHRRAPHEPRKAPSNSPHHKTSGNAARKKKRRSARDVSARGKTRCRLRFAESSSRTALPSRSLVRPSATPQPPSRRT